MDSYFLFLQKTAGVTSQKALTLFKRKFAITKIGHHGTLDPFATGLLLVGVNEATKFFRFIDDSRKTYRAEMKLGERTDTMDLDGKVVESVILPLPNQESIQLALKSLVGKLTQMPPMYSAIKIEGKKLYEYARQGESVERQPREVVIHDLKLQEWNPPFIKFEAEVSRGTYIRVLAEQIAEKLGNVAHLTALQRSRLCGSESESGFLAENSEFIPESCKIPIENLLAHLPRVALNESQALELKQGKTVRPEKSDVFIEGAFATAFLANEFLGVIVFKEGDWRAERMMRTDSIS